MTLEEAIKHAEEVADTCEYEASKYDMSDSYESHVACQEGKCAEEHRQLAEWLKELKQLKEQEPYKRDFNGMTNWEALKSMFPYAEIVGRDEILTAVRIDSNSKVGTLIALYTEWLNVLYSTEPKVRND